MTVSAFDVSRYLLETYGRMSAMKMLKLTFYAQAWHIVATDVPLFHEEIEAFDLGPVVRPLWKSNAGKSSVEAADIPLGNVRLLSAESRELIDAVFAYYGKKSAAELSRLTHTETPWKADRASAGAISVESLHEFYACQLAETDKHPALPSWAVIVVEASKYADMMLTAAIPDDVSSLVERVVRARSQFA